MLSLVIPVYNEAESLPHLFDELKPVLATLKTYEIIFIDDGSTDGSLAVLKSFSKKVENIKIFSFRKNQGKSVALSLGFNKAKGDYIVTLDADLQDKPSEIVKLLDKVKNGYDLVCGWRKDRKDSLEKIISSKLFNALASIFWGTDLHDYNCGLKVIKREAAQKINLYGGMHRFIPLLVHERGFKVTEVPVIHRVRKYGKSKYGFSKIWWDLPDMFTMLFLTRYASRPLHFFGPIGFILILLGLVILGDLSISKFMGHGIGTRPILFLGMLLVISGLQVFFTGFLADLIINLKSKDEKDFNLKYQSQN